VKNEDDVFVGGDLDEEGNKRKIIIVASEECIQRIVIGNILSRIVEESGRCEGKEK
jgi:hypothetical protein